MVVKNNFKIIITSLIVVLILSIIITISLFRAFETEQAKNPLTEVMSKGIEQSLEEEKLLGKAPEINVQQQDSEIEFEGKIKGPLLQ